MNYNIPILIIEDDEAVSALYGKILKGEGYANILHTSTGKAGIEIFKKSQPPIVIIDYNLPNTMTGIDILKEIKSLYPPSQCLLITGQGDVEIIKEALREGACDFFNKPIDNLRFLHAIKRCIESYELLQENAVQGNALAEANKNLEKKVEERTESLKESNMELSSIVYKTVEALTKAVEIKDEYTTGHQERVTMLAIEIAKEMGLTDYQIENIKLAGPIHDIGKIYVPPEFLTKPGKLSDAERGIMQEHAKKGFEILQDIPFHASIADIVRQHHERLDGSGYPDGLKADQILIEARILAVADTIEAMSTDRPYRKTKGIDAAIEVINEDRDNGKMWDKAVNACLKVLKRHNNDVETVLFKTQVALIKRPSYYDKDTEKMIPIKHVNCWDFRMCGREDDCPAYPDHGDCCAAIMGTLCEADRPHGGKIACCASCDFQYSPYFNRRRAKQFIDEYPSTKKDNED